MRVGIPTAISAVKRLLQAGRAGEASALADRILSANPGLADLHLVRAKALWSLGRTGEAAVAGLRAACLAPDRGRPYLERATMLRDTAGPPAAALRLVRHAMVAAGDAGAAIDRYLGLALRPDPGLPPDGLRRAASWRVLAAPGTARVYGQAASALHGLGDRDRSVDLAGLATVIAPGEPTLALLAADLEREAGRPHAAARHARRAIVAQPGAADAAVRALVLSTTTGDGAETALVRVRVLCAPDPGAIQRAAESLVRLQRTDLAAALVGDHWARFSRTRRGLAILAECAWTLTRAGGVDRPPDVELKRLLVEDPGNAVGYARLLQTTPARDGCAVDAMRRMSAAAAPPGSDLLLEQAMGAMRRRTPAHAALARRIASGHPDGASIVDALERATAGADLDAATLLSTLGRRRPTYRDVAGAYGFVSPAFPERESRPAADLGTTVVQVRDPRPASMCFSISVDWTYAELFLPALLGSIAENAGWARAHVGFVDTPADVIDDLLSAAPATLPLSYSRHRSVGLVEVHAALARFLNLPVLLDTFAVPVRSIDVDTLVSGDLPTSDRLLMGADVATATVPSAAPWQRYAGGATLVAPTAGGRRFADALSGLMIRCARERSVWGADQATLFTTMAGARRAAPDIAIREITDRTAWAGVEAPPSYKLGVLADARRRGVPTTARQRLDRLEHAQVADRWMTRERLARRLGIAADAIGRLDPDRLAPPASSASEGAGSAPPTPAARHFGAYARLRPTARAALLHALGRSGHVFRLDADGLTALDRATYMALKGRHAGESRKAGGPPAITA